MIDTILAINMDTLRLSNVSPEGSSFFKDYAYPILSSGVNVLVGYLLATYSTKRTEKIESKKESIKASIRAYELLNRVDKYLFGRYDNAVFSGWQKSEEERKKVGELLSDFEMSLLNNSWLIPLDQYKLFQNILSRFEVVRLNMGATANQYSIDQSSTSASVVSVFSRAIEENKKVIHEDIVKIESALRESQNNR